MLERFQGEDGKPKLIEALRAQKIVLGNVDLAKELADAVELIALKKGKTFIEQNAEDNDIYFIISGNVDVVVNGRKIRARGPGDCVGEMAAIEPTQRRAATVTTCEDTIVAKISEKAFSSIASRYPEIYRSIAQILAYRLLQRNALIGTYREKIRVFIVSSAEALEIGRIIQNALEHDFTVVLWTDGVFKVANYPLESLEEQLDNSDFAIAIAHADDRTRSRGKSRPSPRDNVIFELGMFLGRLNRQRAILMEPKDDKVKLPSDLTGITTIRYRYEPGDDAAAIMGAACNELRKHINKLGPHNG